MCLLKFTSIGFLQFSIISFFFSSFGVRRSIVVRCFRSIICVTLLPVIVYLSDSVLSLGVSV